MLKYLMPLLFIVPAAHATVVREKPVIQSFQGKDDLTEFKISSNGYKVIIKKSISYGTDIKMSFKTKSSADLEKYAIVQFIKGCKFNSYKKPDGSIEKYFGIKRDFFGIKDVFDHPEWVIDSIDTDPMYNNHTKDKRHAYYRWTKNGKEVYFFQEKPKANELYVTDLPGTVNMEDPNGIASNISLKFKTCLYKTSDIPLEARPDDKIPGAIKCFDWASSYIYNHRTKKYESPSEIDSFCK